MSDPNYPRDMLGYGRTPPDPKWPGGARIAVQFVINYEEGGENAIIHGDPASEAFLSEIVGAAAWPGRRHMNMESIYEYGSRVGFWRLWRMFTERQIPVTVYGVAHALMRNPEAVAAMKEADWEIASHGLKWIDYKDFTEAEERAHMAEAIRIHTEVTGSRPLGWYTRIDIIVVYKVDRLTRSLADFAKLVELFDQHGVSFVSVTQSFNTTSSMGRLTLNVLLSFAQFEREVTAERIRDKIAASKRKGIRVGGPVPLGYCVVEKKLVPVDPEAATVRTIFRLYRELGSLSAVLAELDGRGIVTKQTKLKGGGVRGGIRFTKSPLHYLLRNRVYVGELVHKGRHFPGEHVAIIDQSLFDEVQAMLSEQARCTERGKLGSKALFKGKIYDDRGNRMTPSATKKGGARYRYYVSHSLLEGRGVEAGSVSRVPAAEIEAAVIDAVRARVVGDQLRPDDPTALVDCVDRVIVRTGEVEVRLRVKDLSGDDPLRIPWAPAPNRRRREVIRPPGTDSASDSRPIRSESRARLVEAIAKARRWLDDLVEGRARSTRAIAETEGCSERSVRQGLNLAFLAPDLVRAAIGGTLPYGVGVTTLTDLPADWKQQKVRATGNLEAKV